MKQTFLPPVQPYEDTPVDFEVRKLLKSIVTETDDKGEWVARSEDAYKARRILIIGPPWDTGESCQENHRPKS